MENRGVSDAEMPVLRAMALGIKVLGAISSFGVFADRHKLTGVRSVSNTVDDWELCATEFKSSVLNSESRCSALETGSG